MFDLARGYLSGFGCMGSLLFLYPILRGASIVLKPLFYYNWLIWVIYGLVEPSAVAKNLAFNSPNPPSGMP